MGYYEGTQSFTPREALRKVFSQGKVMFLTVIMCISFVITVVDKIVNRFTLAGLLGGTIGKILNLFFGGLPFASAASDLGTNMIMGELGTDSSFSTLFSVVDTIVLIFSLLSLVPFALLVIGLIMLLLTYRKGKGNRGTGLKFIGIYFLIGGIGPIMVIIGAVIGMIALIALLPDKGVAFLVGLILVLIALALKLMPYLYYSKSYTMMTHLEKSILLNQNLFICSKFVIFWCYFNGIVRIIQLIGKFNVITLFSSLVTIISLFIYQSLLKDYVSFAGQVTKEEQKELYRKWATKEILPVDDDGNYIDVAAVNPKLVALIGAKPLPPSENAIQVGQKAPTPVASPAPNPSKAATTVAASPITQKVASRGVASEKASSGPELGKKLLELFPDDEKTALHKRFSIIGHNEPENGKSPIDVLSVDFIRDSLSDTKIIRAIFKNDSGADVSDFIFALSLFDNLGNGVGVMSNIKAENLKDGGICFAKYGIPVSGNVTNGILTISRINFADGLSWEKNGANYFFTSDEKKKYDDAYEIVNGTRPESIAEKISADQIVAEAVNEEAVVKAEAEPASPVETVVAKPEAEPVSPVETVVVKPEAEHASPVETVVAKPEEKNSYEKAAFWKKMSFFACLIGSSVVALSIIINRIIVGIIIGG